MARMTPNFRLVDYDGSDAIVWNLRDRSGVTDRLCVIDAEDYDLVKALGAWCNHRTGQSILRESAMTQRADKSNLLLQHAIMGYPPQGMALMCLNKNRLDCRRKNWRIVTRKRAGELRDRYTAPSNGRIKRVYPNVQPLARSSCWTVGVTVNKAKLYGGCFLDFAQACRAAHALAQEHHHKVWPLPSPEVCAEEQERLRGGLGDPRGAYKRSVPASARQFIRESPLPIKEISEILGIPYATCWYQKNIAKKP